MGRWIRLFLFGAAGLAAIAALAIQFGPVWAPLDLASHFTPQILAVAVVLAAASLSRRWWWLILPAGGLVVPAAAILWGWAAHAVPPAPAAGVPLRVMAYNVFLSNPTPGAPEHVIRAADPDIVVVAEVLRSNSRFLEALADRYPYRAACPADYCSLAVASKTPFRVAGARPDKDHPQYIDIRVPYAGGEVRVIGVHTVTPQYQARHLRQIEALAGVVTGQGGPTVVLGDFNATPFSLILRRFEHETGLSRLTALASWPSWDDLPQVAIDHIFVSPDIAVTGVRLGEPGGSDHYPVIADLVLPPGT